MNHYIGLHVYECLFSLSVSVQDQILAWDCGIELDFNVSHNSRLSFKLDSEYNLSWVRSKGNLIRLCYDSVDCSLPDKVVSKFMLFWYTIPVADLGLNGGRGTEDYMYECAVTAVRSPMDRGSSRVLDALPSYLSLILKHSATKWQNGIIDRV